MPGWWNGRHHGLKIHCPQGRAGSSPAPGTLGFRTNKSIEHGYILASGHRHVPLIASLADHPNRGARLSEQLPDLRRPIRELIAGIAVDLHGFAVLLPGSAVHEPAAIR